ncbi:hypothetical protein SDC9_63764 [bioreactor metagenome]|uniref:Uncharacterized protein n=1 Tax=bioreactor metagenome TaxID=1076179 RepID=A0A644XMJ5_9ZZZZ
MAHGTADFILDAGQNAEFPFNGDIVGMGIFNDSLGQCNVLLIGKVGSINHDGAESVVNALFAGFKAVTVVEVQDDGNFVSEFLGILTGTTGHVSQQIDVGVVACSLRDLKNNGALGGDTSLDDSLKLFHIVEIIGRNGITALDCFSKHVSGIHQTEFLIGCHRLLLVQYDSVQMYPICGNWSTCIQRFIDRARPACYILDDENTCSVAISVCLVAHCNTSCICSAASFALVSHRCNVHGECIRASKTQAICVDACKRVPASHHWRKSGCG